MSALAEKLAKRLAEKIIEAPIINDPWPHFQFDNAFNDIEYIQLANFLPAYKGTVLNSPENGEDDPHYPASQVVRLEKNNTIQFIKDAFHKLPYIRNALAEKFNLKQESYADGEGAINIHRDSKGFWQDPHTDVKRSDQYYYLTFQIYMPPTDEYKHTGAWLCTRKEITDQLIAEKKKFEDEDQVYEAKKLMYNDIKQMPYVKNKAWGFLATEDTHHRVPMMENDITRHSLMYRIYYTK
tara:strand:+ start:12514 stop:13230 length:717 start_codon:yes stop_codon:yes gene_type:complete